MSKMFCMNRIETLPVQELALSQEVSQLVADNCPVAIGVSGGKDSCAVALATVQYLRANKHQGPVILVHSDLGEIEWEDSLPTCERLAKVLGVELVVVRRKAGGMLERWEQRWKNNVARWENLECVKLILPWSTPSMRFCTSELKTKIICAYLKKRFGGRTILSVTGVRADESPARAKQPVSNVQNELTRKSDLTSGLDWRPILRWAETQVYDYLKLAEFKIHEAYTVYGSSRVSCSFCIMSSKDDLNAAAACADNIPALIRVCSLEMLSGFSFQSKRWLTETVLSRLPQEFGARLVEAKAIADQRVVLEAKIPKHMEYVKGWPTAVPTLEEAELLAMVRRNVGQLQNLVPRFTTGEAVIERYRQLITEKEL